MPLQTSNPLGHLQDPAAQVDPAAHRTPQPPQLLGSLLVFTQKPTNNLAERCLRAGVLWRKTSFGTHSELGSRFVERMMTTVATLRLQKRNVLDFLVDASEAALFRSVPPSLLPVA